MTKKNFTINALDVNSDHEPNYNAMIDLMTRSDANADINRDLELYY